MKTIFNLVLFLIVIYVLVIICNNASISKSEVFATKEQFTFPFDKVEKEDTSKLPKGYPTIVFDYESVPEDKTPFVLEDRFLKELKTGAQVHPKYEPPEKDNDKEFYHHELTDQKVIYDNRMYEKPIHKYRSLETNENDKGLPKKISEIFNESITDFKSLVPLMKGTNGDYIIEGGSNQSGYAPDFISYEDEKPENGGRIPKINVYGFDPLLVSDSAIF
jgi:hypothetical protein